MARGSIVERGNSYRVRISYQENGKRQMVTKTAPSRRQAEKLRTEMLGEVDKGSYRRPSKETVSDFMQSWLDTYGKANLTARSQDRYAGIIRVHITPAIGRIALDQLRPEDLQRLYNAKLASGLSARTVKYIHVVVHKALVSAMKWQKLTRNVADGVDIPKARRIEMQTWNEDELTQFLATAQTTHYYPLFYLSLFTGARRGELLALRWCDCDLIGGQISISRSLAHVRGQYIFSEPKSEKSRRTIALPPSASILLRQLRESTEHLRSRFGQTVNDSDLIFTNSIDSKPLRPNTVTRAWVSIAKQAGVKPIRLHDARHTHASLLLKQGVHPKVVSERLGHASIAITLDTYSHVAPGMQEAAAKGFDAIMVRKYNEMVTNEK